MVTSDYVHVLQCMPICGITTEATPKALCCSKCQTNECTGHETICKVCNSRRSTLHKVMGKWPVPCFEEMPPESQTLFWQEGLSNPKRATLQTLLVKHVADNRIDQKIKRAGGKYLPLSVYKAQGYSPKCVENISKNSAHKWDQELDCEVYMLTISEEFKEDIEQTIRTELANFKMGGLRDNFSQYASPVASKSKKSKKKSSSSSSSSSGKSSKSEQVDPKKEKAAKAMAATKAAAEATQKRKADAQAQKAEAIRQSKLAKVEAAQQAKTKKAQAAEELQCLQHACVYPAVTTAIYSYRSCIRVSSGFAHAGSHSKQSLDGECKDRWFGDFNIAGTIAGDENQALDIDEKR